MASFKISLSFKGKSVDITDATTSLVPKELYEQARNVLSIPHDAKLKLLYKGKRLDETNMETAIFTSLPNKKPKVLVIASEAEKVGQVESRKSDPTIRGFTSEQRQQENRRANNDAGPWGKELAGQDKDFKFCRFQNCTDQSFGHRPTESTPHAFEALQLLEKLATDPGVVAIMKERELVVGTLGEMDPIDDRLMQKTQEEHGGCLLGYNTNHGLRIDLKLRSDDLSQFRPYPQLVTTLIHELSHNWVGDHNLLFWTNYGQMRAEYLYTHAKLSSMVVDGKTPFAIAGLPGNLSTDKVFDMVMTEMVQEMRQYGLHPQVIAAPIRQRCEELLQSLEKSQRLGGSTSETTNMTARELALLAAERRAREQKESRKSGDS